MDKIFIGKKERINSKVREIALEIIGYRDEIRHDEFLSYRDFLTYSVREVNVTENRISNKIPLHEGVDFKAKTKSRDSLSSMYLRPDYTEYQKSKKTEAVTVTVNGRTYRADVGGLDYDDNKAIGVIILGLLLNLTPIHIISYVRAAGKGGIPESITYKDHYLYKFLQAA